MSEKLKIKKIEECEKENLEIQGQSGGCWLSDGTLWQVLTAFYFRYIDLPDCAVSELTADSKRNDSTLLQSYFRGKSSAFEIRP